MSSASRAMLVGLIAIAGLGGAAVAHSVRTPAPLLRVCADPNNLPYSNQRGEGFENAIATMIASDLGRRLQYTWWPQRRGFLRTTLRAGVCDVVIGVPASLDATLNTHAYYTSSWAFVTRQDRGLHPASLDDPILRSVSIGVPVVGVDYASVPPAVGLAARHIVSNVHGYSVYGDYSRPNPLADLIDAVARGEVDVAIAWGPIAGYFAARAPVPLEVTSLALTGDAGLRASMAMGVRQGETAFQKQLDDILSRRRNDIDAVLDRYDIVRVRSSDSSQEVRRP